VVVAAHAEPAFALRRRRPRPPKPPTTPLQIEDKAPLSADKQTADVVLTVRCPTGAMPVPIRVTVRQGGVSGSGRTGTNYKCNGQAQRVVAPVTTSGHFHTGAAQASASVAWRGSSHTSTVSSTSNTSATIQLV
jgi:hypothetical protein